MNVNRQPSQPTTTPVTVRVVAKDPQEKLRFVWALLAIGKDGTKRYGKVFPGQEFDYIGDAAGLENDPHLEVISDPDGLVEKAIAARDERVRLANERAAAEKAKRGGRPRVHA